VVLEPPAEQTGTVNGGFVVESIAGDVFQLGDVSYRILRVEPGRVRVENAQGAAPNIPFWLGEAPGRTDDLSSAVSRLWAGFERQCQAGSPEDAAAWAWRRSGGATAPGVPQLPRDRAFKTSTADRPRGRHERA
jgi:ATP-dependent Lhr-like helicase